MSITKIADRVLHKLVPQVDAGACVPDHGESCGTHLRYTFCQNRVLWKSYWTKRVGCNGSCYWSSYAYRVNSACC